MRRAMVQGPWGLIPLVVLFTILFIVVLTEAQVFGKIPPGTTVIQPAAAASSASSSRSADECPSFCLCFMWLGLSKASCTDRRLYSIHTGVSNLVQALDLSNNSINQLADLELSRSGLTRLKYLNLSMNSINEIGLRAFDDLRYLMVLDLSMNHIDYIAPDTFYYIKSLQILNLSGNKFNLYVPNLRSSSIVDLDLSSCRINSLRPDIFQELTSLRKLNIANNLIAEMDRAVIVNVPTLRSIQLGRNIWSCNVAMFSLKMYMRSAKIQSDPVCEKPTLEAKFERIISKTLMESGETEIVTTRKTTLPEPRAEFGQPWSMESWREFLEAVPSEQPSVAESGASSTFSNAFGNVSPFWFLLTGFLLGSGATMLVTYLWLSTTISCLIPKIRRAENVDSPEVNSQRVSLLRHLWQQDSLSSQDENSSRAGDTGASTTTLFLPTPSCPGTPPPPYREVMLHRNLYPRAAMVAAAQQQAATRSLHTHEAL